MYKTEGILFDRGFIRINKSTIVARFGIKKIKPTLNCRFDLILINEDKVYVSKNYSNEFKKFIGF